MATEASTALQRTFDRRNLAIAALVALDGPALSKLCRANPDAMVEVVGCMVEAAGAAKEACRLAGVTPAPLPKAVTANGRAPAAP